MATLPLQSRIKQLRLDDTEPATIADVMEAGRAIRDSVKTVIECKIKDIEAGLSAKVSKALEALERFNKSRDGIIQSVKGSLQRDIDGITSQYSKQISSVEQVYDVYNKKLGNIEMDLGVQMGKILEDKLGKTLGIELSKTVDDRLTKRLQDVEGVYHKNLERLEDSYNKRLSVIEDKYTQDVDFLRKLQEQSIEQMRLLVEKLSMPAPQVVVNQPEIKNDVVVHVPRQATPRIEVKVPEQKTPEVVVNIPQARLVKKQISYDSFGRPIEVFETPIE